MLKNISASGLSLEFVYPTGEVNNPFAEGDFVEVEIDQIGALKGTIIRSTEKVIALKLDINTKDEEELIAQIMAASNQISVEEEN